MVSGGRAVSLAYPPIFFLKSNNLSPSSEGGYRSDAKMQEATKRKPLSTPIAGLQTTWRRVAY